MRDVTKISICCNSAALDENYPATGSKKYDAAVLTLNQPVTRPTIQPLPLATSTKAGDSLEAAGRKATMVGWGLTKNCDPMTDRVAGPLSS